MARDVWFTNIGFVIVEKEHRELVATGRTDKKNGRRMEGPKLYRTEGYARGAVIKSGIDPATVEIEPVFMLGKRRG